MPAPGSPFGPCGIGARALPSADNHSVPRLAISGRAISTAGMNGRMAVLQVQTNCDTEGSSGQQLPGSVQHRNGQEGWAEGGTATRDSGLRRRSAECPQMAVSLMAKQPAALAPGPIPPGGPGSVQQGDAETPAPQEAHTCTHTTHILRGRTQDTRQRPSLPLVRVLSTAGRLQLSSSKSPSHRHRLRDESRPASSLDLV